MAKRATKEKKIVTKLKDLPRHEDGSLMRRFWANGVEYTIRDAAECMSGRRYVEYSKACMQAGMGLDFAQLAEMHDETIRLIFAIDAQDAVTKVAPILKLRSINDSILRKDQEKYDDMQFICTFFIVDATEDLTDFNPNHALEKLDNWNAEGYRVNDFFHLGTHSIVGFHSVSKKMRAEKLKIRNEGIDTLTD